MKKPTATTLPPGSPHILAIEASANRLSIAVMVNAEVVAERQHLAEHGHAVGIVPLAIETLKDAGMTFDVMTHVAAGCGPGHLLAFGLPWAARVYVAHQATGVGVSGLRAGPCRYPFGPGHNNALFGAG